MTLCSQTTEAAFSRRFLGTDSAPLASISEKMLFPATESFNADVWLDSIPEKLFYKDYLPSKFGNGCLRWVTPQVELTSLLPASVSPQLSGRVDFLICHPAKQPAIIEIDGEQHRQQEESDKLRDQALAKEGYRVMRIPAGELANLSGPNLSSFEQFFAITSPESGESVQHSQGTVNCIRAVRICHQLQLTTLQAIQVGHLPLADSSAWNVSADLNSTAGLNDKDSLYVFKYALDELVELLRTLGELYSINICEGHPKVSLGSGSSGIHFSFTGELHPFLPTYMLQSLSVPIDIANAVFTSSPAILDSPSRRTLEYFLDYIFRKPAFWEGQLDAISRTLQGKDSIVLLPTGAGKSIAFQLASFLLPGRAIVIDPIISLMDDQLDNLQSLGIDRTIAITSEITDPEERSKVLALFGQGEYLLAYIAPERLQTVEFRDALRTLTTHSPICLIAVDEAHCVSEWGHDFRTAYLNVGRTSRTYCQCGSVAPPLLALTGTASRAVLKDVQRELQIEDFDAIITPKSFDRPELKFHVLAAASAEKAARLVGYLGQALPSTFAATPASFYQANGKSTFSGLVFCPHVNGEFGVVEVADKIKNAIGIATGVYSGKEPKYYSGLGWSAAKQAVARQFKHNQLALLVCTKAFGMGIDKPNIRFTVHFGIPPSIESFYQEAGRAGRDRRPAQCCILVSVDDESRARKLLDPNTKPEDVFNAVKSLAWDENDDVTRALFFQANAFPGIEVEKSRVVRVMQALGDLSTKGTRTIRLGNLERGLTEKALHRLVVLGIVSDYTINYNTVEFNVRLAGATRDLVVETYGNYVAGYLGARRQAEIDKATKLLPLALVDFAAGMADLLLRFVYEVIERGRRRALSEMLLASTESPNDAAIRARILNYLEATQYSEAIDAILAESDAGLEKTKETFEAIRSPNEAAEMRGQAARYLESYPDHPGVLMLRALSEAYSRDANSSTVLQNFTACVSSASENYGVQKSDVFSFAAWGIAKLADRDIALAQDLQVELLRQNPERSFARALIDRSSIEIATDPALFLLRALASRSKELISL